MNVERIAKALPLGRRLTEEEALRRLAGAVGVDYHRQPYRRHDASAALAVLSAAGHIRRHGSSHPQDVERIEPPKRAEAEEDWLARAQRLGQARWVTFDTPAMPPSPGSLEWMRVKFAAIEARLDELEKSARSDGGA